MRKIINTKSKFLLGVIATVAFFTLCGASCQQTSTGVQASGQKLTEQASKQQDQAVPYPVSQMKYSDERANLRERLLRQNRPNAISYLYQLSYDGKCLGYYVIKGKVSSTESQMTTDQLIEHHSGSDNGGNVVYDAPGDDGSYGPEESGYFAFTANGAMITSDLPYELSDSPIGFDCPNITPSKGQSYIAPAPGN